MRHGMRAFVAWISLVAAIGFAAAIASAEEPAPVAISMVLDCSASMEKPLKSDVAGTTPGQEPSRLDVAKEIIAGALDTFATEGNYHAGLWLLGHRLAWEDAERPQVLDQTDYLAQTNGFKLLANLAPGDDVELVRHVRTVRADYLPVLATQMEVVKPWGESPVYLAMCRAIDEFGIGSKTDRKGIIVLTDGGNEQFMPRQPRSMDDVLKVHYRRHIPVHIIGIDLDAQDHATAIKEYQEIARRTGGTFQQADSAQAMIDAFADAVKQIADGPVAAGDKLVGQPALGSGAVTPASMDRAAPIARNQIQGVVLYAGKPVKNATVKVHGAVTRSMRTGSDGTFSIANLPTGDYDVTVEGITRNKIRETVVNVTVEAPPQEPTYVEAILE